jgi:3-deoxy-manno-octulosonate cytidylyltransferase (CMP-KDO synthetase)
MKVLGVIPARYASSRYPGKPLVDILGKPLVIRVAERTAAALGNENVVIATEDTRIIEVVEQWGYRSVMTTNKPPTGTDRLWEVAQKMEADVYINVQGDEPLILPKDILKILEHKRENPDVVINGYQQISTEEDPESVNIPKVVFAENGDLLYMSRRALPGTKSGTPCEAYYKQVCIYGFSYGELKTFGEHNGKTRLESYEDIEILRFLELGYKVRMVELSGSSLAVDVPEDVQIVEQAIIKSGEEY